MIFYMTFKLACYNELIIFNDIIISYDWLMMLNFFYINTVYQLNQWFNYLQFCTTRFKILISSLISFNEKTNW